MEEDKKITLQEAVSMAGWTHNTNVNTHGFTPMQLATGKNVTFPGVSSGNIVTESLYDDEGVKKIMERHDYINKMFREQEFSRKLEMALNTRFKRYQDGIIEEDDLVYYQAQYGKVWLGLVKVLAIKDILFGYLLIEIQGKYQDVM